MEIRVSAIITQLLQVVCLATFILIILELIRYKLFEE